jgi:RNA polymerase sigma factor (sigma-70 family)
MANALNTTWRRIRSLLGAASVAETTDAQLLARFVAERDEAAFAEIVRRHGPMVHGVCRRMLGNAHDAEDAYQATFLVLSKRAGFVRKGGALSSWLHGVALRVAARLRQQVRKRTDQSPLPADVPQAERDDVSWREVRLLLDEELARLPEQFRLPMILCYLEGKTRDEAAEELGWSLTTFRGRLERGRERLRRRLERRGVALSAALLATLAAKHAEAALPTTTASAQALALATEVMRTMFLSKVKTVAAWCVAVLFLSIAAGGTAYRCVAMQPGASLEAAEPQKQTKPTSPEEDGIVKDFKAHLDQFRLTVALRPLVLQDIESRFPIDDLRLHVSAGPFAEPGGRGTAFARITEKQAAKIIDVLAKDNFFRDSVADADRLTRPEADYVEMHVSYRTDDRDRQTVRRWHIIKWDAHMIEQLAAVRRCVDGEAAKMLDKMLASLREDREEKPKGDLLKIKNVEDLDRVFLDDEGKDLERWVVLDGTLPFAAWPAGLTRAQQELRKEGHKVAQLWLGQKTVEFHATRGPNIGDLVRYTAGPTKVAQEWKGQTPSQLYAKDAFHINVLLIQEGYTPFVRDPKAKWDKKTLTCYESAEQYAQLHKKGIWADPEFAERLKKIAEKAAEKPEAGPAVKWRSIRSTPTVKVGAFSVESLRFSPDGKQMLVRVAGREPIRLLDTETLKEQPTTYPLNDACRPLGFTKSGMAWALSLSASRPESEIDLYTYDLLHLTSGKVTRSFKTPQLVREAALGPDGKNLALTDSGNTSRISLLGNAPGKELTELGKHKNEVRCMAFSPDGKTLATGGKFVRDSAELILWDVEKRGKIAWQELPGNCNAVQFTRDGSRVVALAKGKNREDGDATVLWFSAKNGKLLGKLELKDKGDATAIAASQNGKLLAVVCDHRVHVYYADSGKELPAPESGDQVSAVAFAPESDFLATGDDRGVTLWEALHPAEDSLDHSPEVAIEELLQNDEVAVALKKKIAVLEMLIEQYRERLADPGKEPGYQQAKIDLDATRQALASRRAELLGSLRK